MKALFEFAARGDFLEFLATVMPNRAVQGVTVDVDRTWLSIQRLNQQLPPGISPHVRDLIGDSIRHLYPYPAPQSLSPELYRIARLLPNRPPDWTWTPPWWSEYCRDMGRSPNQHPFVARVCMLPWAEREEPIRTVGWDFPVEIERRPQARLCSTKTPTSPLVGGLSIGVGPASSGTLGGIIEDQRGHRFGLTCAHVAVRHDQIDQPAQSDNASPQKVGVIIVDSGLQISTVRTPCHPTNPQSRLNKIDAALVDLNVHPAHPSELKILTLGKLSRIYPEMDLNPGDTLYFVGKESGPKKRELVVGGLTVVFRFSDDGVNFYSFENTFQVEWPTTVRNPSSDPIESGDSGAWLCIPDGNLHAWAGVAIGCHRDIGYALFAERVGDWIDLQLPHPPLKVS